MKRADSRISAMRAEYCASGEGASRQRSSSDGSFLTATSRPRHMHSYTSPKPPEPCGHDGGKEMQKGARSLKHLFEVLSLGAVGVHQITGWQDDMMPG